MDLNGPGTDATTKVCALCGRIGVRRFRLKQVPYLGTQQTMTVCSDPEACRRRWPQDEGTDDD